MHSQRSIERPTLLHDFWSKQRIGISSINEHEEDYPTNFKDNEWSVRDSYGPICESRNGHLFYDKLLKDFKVANVQFIK